MNALALVVGNVNYVNERHRLINAVNDAEDFAKKLFTLGFIVKKVTNCTREEFDRVVQDFGEELKKFDVGLFYFSGHGLQIDGSNYLTSIDTSFADATSAKHSSLPLDVVIERMQNANPIIKILILDACRNNPLPNQFRSVQRNGLAPIHAPKGTIIAFSTSPGETALDHGSGRNSIYTESLLNHIDDTNIPIEDFFKRVRTSVFTLSNERQTSWEHTSLIGNFYFNSGELIHSTDLPYTNDSIADENFESKGGDVDEIINDLRKHDYYEQGPALKRLGRISVESISESAQFLIGRNILQAAIGGEFRAISIVKNLASWLDKYIVGQENHVLNGILFEIYFNSKGLFRQAKFKNGLVDDIFELQENIKFKSSFDFIAKQLAPFQEFLYYIPSDHPVALPIEVKFEPFEVTWLDKPHIMHRLISIKHEERELLSPFDGKDDFDSTIVNFEQFSNKLQKELGCPKKMLRLSMNFKEDDLKRIYIPWLSPLLKQDWATTAM